MDTSDDDLTPESLDTEEPGAFDTDTVDGDGSDLGEPLAAPEPRPGAGRLLLAILLSLVVAAGGVALWAAIYAIREREYIGIAVLIGLVVGYVMRAVSKRSSVPIRLVAALVTALASLVATVVGEAAYVSAKLHSPFWDLLDDVAKKWVDILQNRSAVSWAVYAAAVVIAFLAASPQKPKRVKDEPLADDEGAEGPEDSAAEETAEAEPYSET